ncbi:ABC transporter ATP-binding protein [Blattabacterium cuenoti]|uniref:ABC transporter ATP-binding protein n=1 Tax=Blattabacterium cuenoti TaxID=1653831 RepID=UPI00163B9556|nr:ABC transporter ATP-binding protein [Blattabacterium cuenoti]
MTEKIHKSYLIQFLKLSLDNKLTLMFTIFLSFLTSLISAYRPKLIQKAIDIHIVCKDFLGLKHLLIWILIFFFLESIFHFLLLYFSNIIAQNIIKKIRSLLFNKLLSLKNTFFIHNSIGKLISYCVSDIETITVIFNDGILLIFGDLLRIIMIAIMMYTVHNKLSFIVFLTIPIMYYITKFFQKMLKKTFHKERKEISRLNSFLQENLIGMSIIQLFNKEQEKLIKFKSINNSLKYVHIKIIFYFSIYFPIVEIIPSLSISLVILYGGFYAIEYQNIKPGQIIAFVFFIYLLFRPIRQIADRFNVIQKGIAGIERIFSILYNDMFINKQGYIKINRFIGHIIFDKVYCSSLHGKKVLNNISFEIHPGEKVAIVGKTGSGKSTIINLISRYSEIEKGNIIIDGYNIQDIELDNLRFHIKTVTQDPFLFNDSIANNISLGDSSITIKKMKKMAKYIGIHNIISSLPNGYHSVVKEKGNILSMGEKQLISLLRVQMHPYSMLILDDSTTFLDTKLENIMLYAINLLSINKTVMIITHRLSILKKIDKILVLHQGNIVEIGSHNDLISLNGYYNQLYYNK